MSTNSLTVGILIKINENQLAIAAAVEELTLWIEQRGSTDVALNVRSALATLDINARYISQALEKLEG